MEGASGDGAFAWGTMESWGSRVPHQHPGRRWSERRHLPPCLPLPPSPGYGRGAPRGVRGCSFAHDGPDGGLRMPEMTSNMAQRSPRCPKSARKISQEAPRTLQD
eukprot:3703178-Pyramimonas_sp.AAC.1